MTIGDPIPVSGLSLSGGEEAMLVQCLREGWVSSRGPWIERFEQAVADRVGRRYAVAVANGSAALEVAVVALGIAPGDEVLLPSHTIISCASAVVRAGGTVRLADSDPASWSIDPASFAARITGRTRAVIVPHLYGLPADMAAIMQVAAERGIAVIEDASQMIGAACLGRPCGSFGAVATFSFFANKNVTTGEGGMVVTDDPDIAARARQHRDLGAQPGRRFRHEADGWNYRLASLAAALGLGQLPGLDARLARKRAIGLLYRERLTGLDRVELPSTELPQGMNTYWAAGLLLRDGSAAMVDALLQALASVGIEGRPFFWPMHRQPVFLARGWFVRDRHPVAEQLSDCGLYLPCGPDLGDDGVHRVCDVLISLMNRR